MARAIWARDLGSVPNRGDMSIWGSLGVMGRSVGQVGAWVKWGEIGALLRKGREMGPGLRRGDDQELGCWGDVGVVSPAMHIDEKLLLTSIKTGELHRLGMRCGTCWQPGARVFSGAGVPQSTVNTSCRSFASFGRLDGFGVIA